MTGQLSSQIAQLQVDDRIRYADERRRGPRLRRWRRA
jgi:hypothetical protein